jgi:hypothetical protein
MDQEKKIGLVGFGYILWQIIFSIAMSPLGFGVLTAEQMGYTLNTALMGIVVGVVFLAVIAAAGIWTSTSIWLFTPGLKHIKTKEEFEEYWKITLRGCDDGIIAETHWSGVILVLFMIAFASIGIPFPINAIPAILCRWILHVGAHFLFPLSKGGHNIFGGKMFLVKGLLISDIKNSLAFIISGSIIAPAMLHHLDGYVTTWTGNKERVAKSLGISL